MEQDAIDALVRGGLVVMPSDTIMGIFCAAHNPDAVERLYRARGRNPEKPCIILISDMEQLKDFGIEPEPHAQRFLQQYWPGRVSVVFDCPHEYIAHLHRGTNTLAVRLPDSQFLRDVIRETGPLLAPSANKEGGVVAKNRAEAERIFGRSVSIYSDSGTIDTQPSTLVRVKGGDIEILRQGAINIAHV